MIDTGGIVERADAWIAAHRQEFITEIQGFAEIPSVSRPDLAAPGAPFGPDCRRVLDHALERGRHYGFDIRDLDGYAGVISMGDAGNAIGMIAHLDVVPEGDGWIYPPFGAVYLKEHDAVVGRGVDDNKSAAVMGLFVMRMLREWGVPMRHGVCLYCGTSEENGMHDMKELVRRGHAFPSVSLVPDAAFPVNYGQKGMLRGSLSVPASGNLLAFDAGSAVNMVPDKARCVLDMNESTVAAAVEKLPEDLRSRITLRKLENSAEITAVGRSGHAAHPDGSVSAIHVLAGALARSGLLTDAAAAAVRGLYELSSDFHGISEGAAFEDEASGQLTLVYSLAHLKDDCLEVGFDCRYPITCPYPDLKETLLRAWEARGFRPIRLDASEPYYIPQDSPCVQALQEVFGSVTGRDDRPYTMGGGTYSRVVPRAVTFGPGVSGLDGVRSFLPEGHGSAHGPDEALPMEKLCRAAKIYAAALLALDAL